MEDVGSISRQAEVLELSETVVRGWEARALISWIALRGEHGKGLIWGPWGRWGIVGAVGHQ